MASRTILLISHALKCITCVKYDDDDERKKKLHMARKGSNQVIHRNHTMKFCMYLHEFFFIYFIQNRTKYDKIKE